MSNKTDDELVLEIEDNDYLIEQTVDSVISQQSNENLLSYSIDNLFKDDKKEIFITGKALKNNPPLLTIKDSNENEVQFSLTKEFAKELYNSLELVNRAYSGYRYNLSKEKKSIKEQFIHFVNNFKNNPLQYGFISLLILGLIVLTML